MRELPQSASYHVSKPISVTRVSPSQVGLPSCSLDCDASNCVTSPQMWIFTQKIVRHLEVPQASPHCIEFESSQAKCTQSPTALYGTL